VAGSSFSPKKGQIIFNHPKLYQDYHFIVDTHIFINWFAAQYSELFQSTLWTDQKNIGRIEV